MTPTQWARPSLALALPPGYHKPAAEAGRAGHGGKRVQQGDALVGGMHVSRNLARTACSDLDRSPRNGAPPPAARRPAMWGLRSGRRIEPAQRPFSRPFSRPAPSVSENPAENPGCCGSGRATTCAACDATRGLEVQWQVRGHRHGCCGPVSQALCGREDQVLRVLQHPTITSRRGRGRSRRRAGRA